MLYERRAVEHARAAKRGLRGSGWEVDDVVNTAYTSSKCPRDQSLKFLVDGSASAKYVLKRR